MELTSEFTLTVILVLVMTIFVTAIIKRKYKGAQYPIYLLTLIAFGLWSSYSINSLDVTGEISLRMADFSFVPFANLFKESFVNGEIVKSLDVYIFIILSFSIIWGICIAFLMKKPSLKRSLKATTFILVPVNTLFGILYILGLTSKTNFDLSSYIFIYLFAFLGYKLYETKFKKEMKTND